VTVRDIKLGTFGSSVHNRSGAAGSVFERVRFRGGGGASQPDQNVLQLGGAAGSCRDLTFSDCAIERNLISDATKAAAQGEKQFCNVAIVARAGGSNIDAVTFDGCQIGVSNGRSDVARNTGSPFASFLCWTANESGTEVYSNIVVKDCVFEVSDWDNVDLADYRAGTVSGPVTVTGCTFKGAGSNTFCIEGPRNVLVANNTFWRSRYSTLAVSPRGATRDVRVTVRDNVFALDVDNGITPLSPDRYVSLVHLGGTQVSFTGNLITTDSGGPMVELQELAQSTMANNTLNELRTSGAPWALNIWDSRDNTISGNTFRTAASTNPVIHYQGTNANNTLTGNVFRHN
jgi:hypothetical protein